METTISRSGERPVSPEQNTEDHLEYENRFARGEALKDRWDDPPGFIGWFKSLQNDTIGGRIMLTAFIFFIVGGLNALLLRVQLAQPENNFLSPEVYNQLFTMHGSTMMYLFAVPMLEGFAIILLPILLGNREMPFPRLGVFSYFTFAMGGILFYASFFFRAVPDTGWFAYVPLSGLEYSPGIALDFWLLALGVAEVAAIAAGVEIVIAILRMRAPGMSISRMPVYAWAMLITAVSLLFAFTVLLVGSALMEFDRKFLTAFYVPERGGSPVLWQHLFWIFGHPEVYIQFLPAVGMVSMIVPVFARRRLVGYPYVVVAMVATGFISFGLWVHHMFTVGLPEGAMSFFAVASMLIAIPAGIQIFAYLATIWGGRPVWKTPFLFVVGFLFLFVIGGLTGVMVASVPFDWQVHDSFFVVAHFHYVLIGGVTFPLFGALYYWLPKFTGRLMNERLGKWHFWLFFIGFNITFFPMHIVGLLGMPRRVYTYAAGLGWDPYNLISTVGAFIIAASVLVFVINVVYSHWKGEVVTSNPWGADTLEWATTSPPVSYGFAIPPVVRSRHPLWDQDGLHSGDERLKKFTDELGKWPTTWRAAVITDALDGTPQEVFRVSGPSIWPFIAAVGMVTIFAAEIFVLRWLVAVGALTIISALIGWHWPDKAASTAEEEQEFERKTGVPVYSKGSRAVARAGMALALLVLGVALGTMLLSYFYIRLENPIWPPDQIPNPPITLPAIAVGLILLAAGAAYWALRSARNDNQTGLKTGLGLSWALTAAATGLEVYSLYQLGYNWTLNGYASIFYLAAAAIVGYAVFGLGMGAMVQFWAWRGEYGSRHHVAVDNLAMFWFGLGIAWVVTVGVLYLTPVFS